VISVSLWDTANRLVENPYWVHQKMPRLFKTGAQYFDSLLNKSRAPLRHEELKKLYPKLKLTRAIDMNAFSVESNEDEFKGADIPFVTNHFSTAVQVLLDTFKTEFAIVGEDEKKKGVYYWESDNGDITQFHINNWNPIHSRPTDSVLRPMMHQSDNFLAEQCLLMVSNERLGVMSDRKIIDTLLKTDFADLPQTPRWVDGSGLSRYNLFTPQDFVAILSKMQNSFSMERLKRIFPTSGQGTLRNYYNGDSAYLFAKTGTLSGVVALSGYLYTRKGKLLVFSILVNNHRAQATEVRRALETFLQEVRSRH
jgi:D-alanyl-D-alanine carboxypeptidase/D-alanyl-D-alanine-endopeptidase (penicillin-binding protein 4)